MTSDVLLRARDGAVLVATLNRPARANAINGELMDALDELAAELADEHRRGDVGALVLTGAGQRAFSAGADISELRDLDLETARQQMRRGQQVFTRLECLPIAVVAAIDGVAFGGGLELAMAADIRVAAPTARLGQPEITLANLPGWGGTQRLPRLIGRGPASLLILTGEPVTGERAFQLGLVDVLASDVRAIAVELAARIASRSGVAVAGAKRAIRLGLERGMEVGLATEADAVAACCQTAEQRDAVQAFLTRHGGDPATAAGQGGAGR